VFADTVLRNFSLNTINNNMLIANSADLQLKALYGATPDLTPADGSVALTGANFDGADFTTFFTPVAYRGAIGSTNWAAASNWAVWK
jgi:hypothetical protein